MNLREYFNFIIQLLAFVINSNIFIFKKTEENKIICIKIKTKYNIYSRFEIKDNDIINECILDYKYDS